MSEKALIPPVPSVSAPKSTETVVRPDLPDVPDVPETIAPDSEIESTATTTSIQVSPPDSSDSITTFQGITYASFILTFCLSGFAAVAIFRKALKTSVTRFSISAKTLALAYLGVALNGTFATYLYSNYLRGGEISTPFTFSLLAWILAGPAIAVVLNSLLTREDTPGFKKIIFDAFIYFIIFGCIVTSQIPGLENKDKLVFAFLGVLFFIVPVIRFMASLNLAKTCHPELREIFVQILIRCLLFIPLLLPLLIFVNACGLASDEIAILLLNLITSVFVLMTGLLMIISIDYITQGISADQLVAKKSTANASSPPTVTDQPIKPEAHESFVPQKDSPSPIVKNPQIALEKSTKPKKPVATDALTETASTSIPIELPEPSEESFESADSDIEKHDSTVIKFDVPKPSNDELQETDKSIVKPSAPKKAKVDSSGSKPKSVKTSKSLQQPKPPQSPNSSKSLDSKSRIKAPDKPKKRF